MARYVWLAVSLVACAKGGNNSGDDDTTIDAACELRTFFHDGDGDMHGDPAGAMMACTQPPGTVTVGDDCDDRDANRFPGAPEICDGVDNDCNPATVEQCPAACAPIRRPAPDNAHVYLFCNQNQAWNNARAICASAMFTLVQIDDGTENAWIRTQANTSFGGVDLHIGGTDQMAEGAWLWDGGTPFWDGGPGGTAAGGRFANWVGGEPNDDGTEDCAEMKPNGQWNDGNCGDGQRFVCRR